MPIKVIAHRGYSSERPENTITSFDWALDSGFNCIELDIRQTRDGALVVIHDESVDRTTDGKGLISELTLENIKGLDAGSWFAANYSEQTVPTLKEILTRYFGRAHIFIEIKSVEEDLVTSLRESIIENGWMPNSASYPLCIPGISVISFLPEQLLLSRKVLPELDHGFLVTQGDDSHIEFCLENGIRGLFPYFRMVDIETISLAKKENLYTGVWGMESPEQLRIALELGVDGVTVNWPAEAQDFFAKNL